MDPKTKAQQPAEQAAPEAPSQRPKQDPKKAAGSLNPNEKAPFYEAVAKKAKRDQNRYGPKTTARK